MSEDRALAATRHWLERAVIGLNLCPFARAVYLRRRVRLCASPAREPDEVLAVLAAELAHLASVPPETTETTLLVLTEGFPDFLDFHFFQQEVAALLRREALAGIFQVAPFHPRWEFAGSNAADVENCAGRAPFPTLHLLREASIDRAVSAFPDASRIYDANRITLRELGREGWRRLLEPSCDGPAD
ncbi:MAG: DUF1415 domain-containing protein [Gammaproteobacteria bacterium]